MTAFLKSFAFLKLVVMRPTLILFILVAIHASLYAQQPVYFSITQQQDLPSNTIYDLFQDSKGFLWIATENGLARYNGVSFLRYTNNQVRSTAVTNLFEDSSGNIWLHNFYGEILSVQNDSLTKLRSWENYYTEGFPIVTNLGDSLLISSTQKLYYYAITSGQWMLPKTNSIQRINHHAVSLDGTQWLCYTSNSHTYVKSLNKTSAPTYQFDNAQYALSANVVRIIPWRDKLWLFNVANKQLFELKDGFTTNISALYKSYLTSTRQIETLGDSLLVFAGSDGAYLMNHKNEVSHFLPGKNVSAVTLDREKGMWIGTLNEGLFYFPSVQSILYPKEVFGLYTKLTVDHINNRVIAGAYTGRADVFSSVGRQISSLEVPTDKEVQAIFADSSSKQLHIYTNILRSYSSSSGKQLDEKLIPSVKQIVRAGTYLAMATSAGLLLVDTEAGNQETLFDQQRITTVTYDAVRNKLWAGTQKGLYVYSFNTRQYHLWQADSTHASPGASRLLQLTSGTIVIGTFTNGVYLVDPNNRIFSYNTGNGLPSERVTSLTDSKHTLWIGTDKGIAQLNLNSEKITVINYTQGLAAEEVYDMVWFNNQLWISHAAGLQVISPQSSINTQPPLIQVSRISSNEHEFLLTRNEIILQPHAQQLTIQFDVSNNLKSRGATKIYYRIKELNNGLWSLTTLKNPVANFMALPYGDFTFEAKAVNEDGVESINTLCIPITVLAPYWEQAWFRAILFLLALCVLGVLIYFWLNRMAKENKLKLQQQELRIARLTSIRAQMNPHFIFNTMALIQGNVLKNLKEDATRTLHNFSTLMRKVLDFSGREMITLQEEIEVLEKYLAIEKDRFNDTLEYNIVLNDDARHEVIRIPSLITQPFVENALRHGLMHKDGLKKLTIAFILTEASLEIKIEDNGIGRKASAEFNRMRKPDHVSFAMQASEKRIDLINASRSGKIELQITDKRTEFDVALGTLVSIIIPMRDEHIR